MRFEPLHRPAGASQQPVSAETILGMAHRAFGPGVPVVAVTELGDGTYNNTYRVELTQREPVILRVAPAPAAQWRSERGFMRNEFATTPYLAGLGPLVPRTLFADFTHDLVNRDYLFQTLLPGVPAPAGLGAYPRSAWRPYFRDMGSIARRFHAIRGPHFGQAAGPAYESWPVALHDMFAALAADLAGAGLAAAGDAAALAELAGGDRALAQVNEPRLLHGDLWTINVLLEPNAPEPHIIGVFDADRCVWGDPLADWTIHLAQQRPGTERDAFWETYGPLPTDPASYRRIRFYLARHLANITVERLRLGRHPEAAESSAQLGVLRRELAAG
jgi:aminoglycoside phosphotransferase (APT) family kinase protein